MLVRITFDKPLYDGLEYNEYRRTFLHTLSLAELLKQSVDLNFLDVLSIAEIEKITDKKILTESITFAEVLSKIIQFQKEISDTLTISEELSKISGKTLSDSIDIFVLLVKTIRQNRTDNIFISDTKLFEVSKKIQTN